MAVPSLLQMIFGAPRIILSFGNVDMEDSCYLSCIIHNEPIDKGLLKILGVRREQAQDVTAMFEIQEQGTNKIICPPTSVKIRIQQDVLAERISLPASFFPARFAILGVDKRNNEIRVYKEQKQLLSLGAYTAKVAVLVGPKGYAEQCNFTVEDKYPFVHLDVSS